MSPRYLPRTVTPIDDTSERDASRPLSEYREARTYVLLGDPGAGKTRAFEHEAEADRSGRYVPARDFLRGDIDDLPNISKTVLFIDGLDEVRVGSSNPRAPLDEIVKKLRQFGQPSFRLSCRPTEWGLTDRRALKSAAGNELVVLRLDPLGPVEAHALLKSLLRDPSVDPSLFLHQAIENGFAGWLGNPQSLELLAKAVVEGRWPDSRRAVFEAACCELACELNQEHLDSRAMVPDEDAPAAAGEVMALTLLTGATAICKHSATAVERDLVLSRIAKSRAAALCHALGTKLFSMLSPGRFVPMHHQVAEYLGARYLANLIRGSGNPQRPRLPGSRVLALILGDDGGVVSALRGLAAWLASLCPEVRPALIRADPIGLLSYGDATAMSTVDRKCLIRSLEERCSQIDGYPWPPVVLDSLIDRNVLPLLADLIPDRGRDRARQVVVEHLVRGIRRTATLRGDPLSTQALVRVARDETWWPRVRYMALNAALRTMTTANRKCIMELMDDIKEGRVDDADGQLRASLLIELYPAHISPARIWHYFPAKVHVEQDSASITLSVRLEEKSSDDDVLVLMDGIANAIANNITLMPESLFDRLVNSLLSRALNACGEELDTSRLLEWIERAVEHGCLGHRRGGLTESGRVQSWFASHPKVGAELLACHRARHANEQEPAVSADDIAYAIYGDQSASENGARSRQPDWSGQSICEPVSPRKKLNIRYILERRDSLASAQCEPMILHEMARIYLGVDSSDPPSDPVGALRMSLGDKDLVAAALAGLRRVHRRDDVPGMAEIVRLDEKGEAHSLALPLLAGFAEMHRQGEDVGRVVGDDVIKGALACHYLTNIPQVRDAWTGHYRMPDTPAWYLGLLETHRQVVAEVMVTACSSRIRRDESCGVHLLRLVTDGSCKQLARDVVPELVEAVPVRCTQEQDLALYHLLGAAVRYTPHELTSWVAGKLDQRSMDVEQQALWLAAGVAVAPGRYLAPAADFINNGAESRVRRIVVFLQPDEVPPPPTQWSATDLAEAVRTIGARIAPWVEMAWVEMAVLTNKTEQLIAEDVVAPPLFDATAVFANKAEQLIRRWLKELESDPSPGVAEALESLADDERLDSWRDYLMRARDRQAELRRQEMYEIPTLEEVQTVLWDGEPVNVADLAGLLVDRLEQLATEIRDGNTNGWLQYWNVDSHGRPKDPRPEPTCRDALLLALRGLLPAGAGVNIDAQPEAQYADGKRADIRVACDGHAVPVEIKRNSHQELWSAINTQLIAKYARAPESGGFGVYLVLWFGAERTKTVPPSGPLPDTPKELQQRLEDQVPPSKRRKIKVVVVDVSRPGDPTA